MPTSTLFYMCPTCFIASSRVEPLHEHAMIGCPLLAPDDESRRPVIDSSGRLLTHAPRWFLDQVYPPIKGQTTLRPAN